MTNKFGSKNRVFDVSKIEAMSQSYESDFLEVNKICITVSDLKFDWDFGSIYVQRIVSLITI